MGLQQRKAGVGGGREVSFSPRTGQRQHLPRVPATAKAEGMHEGGKMGHLW